MKEKELKINEVDDLFKTISFINFKKSFSDFKNYDIHPGQIMIINIINDHPGIKQKELVDITKREKATITIALQRLEKSGFVFKNNDPFDKRSSLFYLTDKGKDIVNKFRKKKKEDLNNLLSILSEEDIDKILEILHKIKMNLEEKTSWRKYLVY